jgi:predicted CoA-binding protein
MTQRELIADAVNRRVWAVVGASNDRAKFGNRIYRVMREAGYRVYPVNPTADEVEGDRAYPSLGALPERPDVADIVVPATVGMQIADDAKAADIPFFWLQPGAESPELIEHAEALGLNVIHDACAMVERRTWSDGER